MGNKNVSFLKYLTNDILHKPVKSNIKSFYLKYAVLSNQIDKLKTAMVEDTDWN